MNKQTEPSGELIRKSIEGDADAFGQLACELGGGIYSVAFYFLRDRCAAEDAVQEILLKIFNSIFKFKGGSSFSTWVYRITANHCMDAARKMKASKGTLSLDAIAEANPSSSGLAGKEGEREMEKLESRLLVEKAFKMLSPEERLVLVLREISGLDYEEIARVMDCGTGTVKSRLFRARLELKEQLDKLEPVKSASSLPLK